MCLKTKKQNFKLFVKNMFGKINSRTIFTKQKFQNFVWYIIGNRFENNRNRKIVWLFFLMSFNFLMLLLFLLVG